MAGIMMVVIKRLAENHAKNAKHVMLNHKTGSRKKTIDRNHLLTKHLKKVNVGVIAKT
jgi:hypothetical protein